MMIQWNSIHVIAVADVFSLIQMLREKLKILRLKDMDADVEGTIKNFMTA